MPAPQSSTHDESQQTLKQFDVLRFGVQSKDSKTASVVGLADYQTHVIRPSCHTTAYIVQILRKTGHGRFMEIS